MHRESIQLAVVDAAATEGEVEGHVDLIQDVENRLNREHAVTATNHRAMATARAEVLPPKMAQRPAPVTATELLSLEFGENLHGLDRECEINKLLKCLALQVVHGEQCKKGASCKSNRRQEVVKQLTR